MFTMLLAVLAIAYIVLKVINTRARFEQKDAEMQRQEQENQAAMEEEEELRSSAVDVEAEITEAEDDDLLDD